MVHPRLTGVRAVCALSLAAYLFGASPSAAQTAVPLLVEADWLKTHAGDSNLVLLHVGTPADYDSGHIAGARPISEDDVSLPHDMSKMASGDLMLELPAPEVLRRTIAALGISDSTHIVVYAGTATALQSSTRIVFTLDYLGLGDRTSLLNGGVASWTKAGGVLTRERPRVEPGRLTARPTRDVVATAANVRAPGGARLIDARAAVYYRGIDAGMLGVKGHIPGAVNIPFSEIADNQQRVDRDRLAKIFEAAGVHPGDAVIAYCHVGQQATAVVFAARLLGHPVKLYDGSFQEWATVLKGPVE